MSVSKMQEGKRNSQYVTVCSTILGRSSSNSDFQTVETAELRLKLRPSMEPPRPWKSPAEKNTLRPSASSGKMYNYRYGLSNIEANEKAGFDKHRRFRSVPEIKPLVSVDDFRVANFQRRFSTAESQNRKQIASKTFSPQQRRHSCGVSSERGNDRYTEASISLAQNVKEFLEKPIPKQPPKSLRIFNESYLVDETPFQKHREEEEDENKEVINTDTAPPLNAFGKKPWQYHEKDSCRYLRVEEKKSLPVESIFRD